jgi:hypothetical protein
MVVFLIMPVIIIYFLGLRNVRLITRLLFVFTRNISAVVWLLALLFLPGTFVHEIAHLLIAEGMLVQTNDLHLIPQVMGDQRVKLGGIRIQQTDPVRRTLIGLAPIMVGIILIWTASYITLTYFPHNIWAVAAYIYVLVQVSHTMFSSRKDLEGVFFGLIAIGLIMFFAWWVSTVISIPLLTSLVLRVTAFFTIYTPYLRYGLWYGVLFDFLLTIVLWTMLKLLQR